MAEEFYAVLEMRAENVLRLTCAEISPTDNIVELSGNNAAGKSSVLNSIEMAIAGEKAIPSTPVHAGAQKGMVRLAIGQIDATGQFLSPAEAKKNLIVTRTFTARGGTSLVVKPADPKTAPWGTPQAMLDDLRGFLSFDPLAFTRMRKGEQLETLRGLVKLDVDIDALDAANAADYARRTIVNREVDKLKAKLSDLPEIPDVPDVEVDVSAISSEMQRAAQANQDITDRKARREREKAKAESLRESAKGLRVSAEAAKNREVERYKELASQEDARAIDCDTTIRDYERDIESLKAQIVTLEVKIRDTQVYRARCWDREKSLREHVEQGTVPAPQDAIESLQMADQREEEASACEKRIAEAPPLPEPVDLSDFNTKIAAATKTNESVRQKQARNKMIHEHIDAKRQSDALTSAIAERTGLKERAIAKAKFPVEGLGFGANEVLYHGLPFAQASQAEQTKISLAIGMSLNPKLKVIFIRDASLLDDDQMFQVCSMARERGYQLWLEKVKSDSPTRIELIDGVTHQKGEEE